MSIAREESVTDHGDCEWCDDPARFRYELWRWVSTEGRRHKEGIKRYVYSCSTHRQNAAAVTLDPLTAKR